MSLFDSLQTSVAGVSAQTTQLGIIGTNVTNATTTGYKVGAAHFDTLLGDQGRAVYVASQVTPTVRYSVAAQGTIGATASPTDLAINGKGFFLVRGPDGTTALTRAGSFVPDANGNLVNAAGYTLLGYAVQGSGAGSLQPVSVPTGVSSVRVSTGGVLSLTDANGNMVPAYQIPLGNVESPDALTALESNVYLPNNATGALETGSPRTGNLGEIDSSALESSTADLANELTNLISTQQAYNANAKAMNSSSEMLSRLLDAAS